MSEFHQVSTKIKNRKEAKDVFITPVNLAKEHINIILDLLAEKTECYDNCPKCGKKDLWYDPFKATGNYYKNFPEESDKIWAEISEGVDFFEKPTKPPTAIVSNPPYSILQKVLEQSVKLRPLYISYLIGIHNLTPKRLEFMEKEGYVLVHFNMFKVYDWFGMSCMATWERNDTGKKSIISFNRTIWRD